ncbi:MAG: hypothetical protein ACR2IT_01395 [Pirellulales bacterium]
MNGRLVPLLALLMLTVGGRPACADEGPSTAAFDTNAATGNLATGNLASGSSAAGVEFVRVHVPAGRIRDLPLDGERLVPMPLAEFERAAARLGDVSQRHPGPRSLADVARYVVSMDGLGRLVGTLEFEIGPVAATCLQMPLGRIDASAGLVRTADGVGEAAVFGLPDGGIAMRIPGPGTYSCHFTFVPPVENATEIHLPLVPALATRIDLTLADGVRPIVSGDTAGMAVVGAPSATTPGTWRIDLGATESVRIAIASREARQPRLRVWNRVVIRGGQAELTARVVPDAAWISGAIALRRDQGLDVTRVRPAMPDANDIDLADADPRRLLIDVPAALAGTRIPIDIVGVAKTTSDARHVVPTVRPAAERWAGGGITVVIDPGFVVESSVLEECVAVDPAIAARWPVLPTEEGSAAEKRQSAAMSARLYFEQQSAAARVAVQLRRRGTELDSVRITTVEISPGAVLGRAACDLRVVSGEAFGVTAKLGAGWFIDSVEAVDWGAADGVFDQADAEAGDTRAAAVQAAAVHDAAVQDAGRAIDWRVVRSAGISELRIGLAEAATRSRGLGLRITGHRQGVPVGGDFVTGDMDMVRFEGESAGSALVEFRVGPEAVIEVEGSPIGIVPAEGRLAALVEPGSPRGRIMGGDRATSRAARLVRRRPPLEASAQVQLVARDGQLFETFLFTCRPDAGDVDAIVVHFSEPLGESMEWSLVEPSGGTVLARRLGVAESERGDLARLTAIRDSWLVEFRPAIEGEVTFRGSRSMPFVGPVPMPLAWVEGGTEPRGTLVVRAAGSVRPRIVNRRLTELPPSIAEDRETTGLVTDMAYGDPATVVGRPDELPAAELVPTDVAEARAWAWREITTAWCHNSGRSECHTDFEIENRGRDDLMLTVPRGLRLEELFIDGESLPFDGPPTTGGEVRVGLPPGRGRLRLVARGIVEQNPGFGLWRIDSMAIGIDVPVLDRRLRLMVPPDLEVSAAGVDLAGPSGWIARLFDAASASAADRDADAGTMVGFRRIDMPSVGGTNAGSITVVRRRLVASTAIACGLVAAAAMFPLMRWRPSAAVVGMIAAAIAALWLDPPLTTIARAIWWGALAGVWCAGPHRLRLAAVGVAIVWSGVPLPVARADEAPARAPYRVLLMTEEDAGTVLVPEPLFRLLAQDEVAAAEAVRVQECRLVVAEGVGAWWRLLLDIDADRGGMLVLDQAAGHWRLPEGWLGDARGATVQVDGSLARIVATAPGRHRVELEVMPEVVRTGIVETSIVHLPPAPRSTVEIMDTGAANAITTWQCESGDGSGFWRPVIVSRPSSGDGHDVSRASRIRLSRSIDPRHPLAATATEATSVNDVVWRRDSCLVKATYDITAGRNTIRSVVMSVDPRLEPLVDTEHPVVPMRLADGRYLVEFPEPAAGPIRLEMAFLMPLVDPVGVFDVPAVWLEGVGNDARMVRCAADADLDVIPELPSGLSLMRPREDDGPGVVAVWRSDAVTPGFDPAFSSLEQASGAGNRPVPRVAVRRRPQPHRIAQRLEVDFAVDHVGLALDCQIDALSSPLTEVPIEVPEGATVDRLTLVAEAGELPAPVDIFISRSTPTRVSAVVQQPRCGRFQLRMEVRTRERPAASGRMPLARCVFPDNAPLAVTWRCTDGLAVELPAVPSDEGTTGTATAVDVREVSPGESGPDYVLAARAMADAIDGPSPSASRDTSGLQTPIGNIVEATTVHLAIDRRGRGWGLVRFDLAAAEPVVRLRLPPGMRLFDLLIDGRETQATPAAGDAWDVRLHDIQWPRSMVAVFAGDAGGRPDTGAALRLEPPRLEGLPCREVLWTIDPPEGMRLRVAESAPAIESDEWQVRQDAVRRRMAKLFTVAIDQAPAADRERLEAFAASREAGDLPPLESAWQQAVVGTVEDGVGRVHIRGQGAEGVTIRVVRRSDDTTSSRAIVTVGLVAMLAFGWSAAARWPMRWSNLIAQFWPWALSAAGGAWVMLLSPSLPGWALLAAGFAAVAARAAGNRVDEATAESGLARLGNGR